MSAQVSESSITYLKDELALTVDRVQQSLESYSEYPDSVSDLAQAAEYLRQMAGVLVMLDAADGAAFARELAELVSLLAGDGFEDPGSARTLLLQESLHLEPYLDGLRRGDSAADRGVDVVRALNRIRALLGKTPVRTPAVAAPELDADTLDRIVLRQLRPNYQHALANVFRGQQVSDQLCELERVTGQLGDICSQPEARELWWVCGRLLHLLHQEKLDLSASVLPLLGAVDRQIKHLIDSGEQGLGDASGAALRDEVETLLKSVPEGQELLNQRPEFGPVGRAAVDGVARAAPNAETLKEVATNLADDVSVLQDAIDRIARGADSEQVDMADVASRLNGAAAVLSMLNMNSSANLLQQQYRRVSAVEALDEPALRRLVADLVLVETSLSALMDPALSARGVGDEANFDDPETQLQAIKHLQARMAATEQAIADMEQVLELTQQIHAGGGEPLWQPVAPLLHRVANVFSILGHQEAGSVCDRLRRLVSDEQTIGQVQADPAKMAALAESMVAIEYFLKAEFGVEARNPRYLSHAERRLALLEGDADAAGAGASAEPARFVDAGSQSFSSSQAADSDADVSESEEAAEALLDLEQIEPSVAPNPDSDAVAGPVDPAAEALPDADEPEPGVSRSDPFADDLLESLESLDQDAQSFEAEIPFEPDDTPDCAPVACDDQTDSAMSETPAWVGHEFLDVFLEEAEGEIAQLREVLPGWRENPEVGETLAGVRRSFHTLKGSGRMVGADRAGEFAWAVEELLNRTLEGHSMPLADLGVLLGDAVDVFNDLIAQMQQGNESVDLEPVSARVREMQRWTPQDPEEKDPAESVQVDTVDDGESTTPLEADPEMVSGGEPGITEPASEEVESGGEPVAPELSSEAVESDAVPATDEGLDSELSSEAVEFDAVPATDEGLDPELSSEAAEFDAAPAMDEGLDPELVEIFVQEATDILDSSDVVLDRWSQQAGNLDLLADLRREMHTLKGSSRMAGFLVIGDLAHSVEFVLDSISKGESEFSPATGEILQRTLDRFHGMVAVARHLVQPEAAGDLIALLSDRDALQPSAADIAGADPIEAQSVVVPSLQASPEPSAVADAVMLVPDAPDMVRVSVDLLDTLADQMGESSIYRARIAQNVVRFDQQVKEMDHTVLRLSEKLRRLEIETETQILFRYERGSDGDFEEFDPLELDRFSELQQLSRSLMEVVNDLNSIRVTLDEQTQDLDTLLHQQAKVNHEIQEGLTRTRMVRFDSVVPRMRRVVRQTADELGKRAELVLTGSTEMERGLLEHVVGPLEHILRNAVSHGIEAPEDRKQGGKGPGGRITLDMRREGSELVLEISDDGAGINFDAVRRKAEKAGFLQPGQPTSKDQLLDVLMMPGFSTADRLTQVSGRGVGMDVVNDAVRGLGGSLSVDSEHGKGACFSMRLPFSLSITKALLVDAGGDTYAIPLAGIEAMTRISSEELRTYAEQGSAQLVYGETGYGIHSLGALLGGAAPQGESLERRLPAMLVQSEGVNVAFQIDAVLGSEEIIVKPAGPQVNSVPGLAGATILGDGRVVLMLEMAALVRNFVVRSTQAEAMALQRAKMESEESKLQVMVVDDSITMRKVTSRLLERHDVDALLAKDGLDAAGQLEDMVPDAVVLDIEMPRMDGFELAAHIRNQEHLWHLPIIMVTSRSGDKHRQRAKDLGVNEYLGKPYREEELVSALHRVLGEKAARLAGV